MLNPRSFQVTIGLVVDYYGENIDTVARSIVEDPEFEDHREMILPLAQRIVELIVRVEELEAQYAPAEMTTSHVAVLLNVSRPFVCKLIDEGKLPARRVGKHRRVSRSDFEAYRKVWDAERDAAMDELAAVGQEIDLSAAEDSTYEGRG